MANELLHELAPLVPDYAQLGFRVPAIVVSNRARRRVVHDGPFEHTSTLKMIESTFGLHPLTARDANAMDLRRVLRHETRHPVPPGPHPDQQPSAGTGQRRRRGLQRRQRPVSLSVTGIQGQEEARRAPSAAVRVSDRNRDGGIGTPLQQGDNQVGTIPDG